MDRYTGYTFDDQGRWTRGVPLRSLDDIFAFVLVYRHACARVLVTDGEDYGVMESRQGELTFPYEARDLFNSLKGTFTLGSDALDGIGYSYRNDDHDYAIGFTGGAFEAYYLADVGPVTVARSERLVGCLQAILDHQTLFDTEAN